MSRLTQVFFLKKKPFLQVYVRSDQTITASLFAIFFLSDTEPEPLKIRSAMPHKWFVWVSLTSIDLTPEACTSWTCTWKRGNNYPALLLLVSRPSCVEGDEV